MNPDLHIQSFGSVLIYLIGAVVFVLVGMSVARILRPSAPNSEKLESYECGEEASGTAWTTFHVRFYILAIIFLLFEAELVFLFPWSVVYADKKLILESNGVWLWIAIIQMAVFLTLLIVGYIFAWQNGFLDWVSPNRKLPTSDSPVPAEFYQKVNQKYLHATNPRTSA